MANRYTNLDGTRRINETYNQINVGFDKVQEDMDKKETPGGAQEKIDQAKADAIKAAADALTAHKQRGADEHPAAAANAAGFMSAADKKKIDASTVAATPSTLMLRDASGRAQAAAPAAAADIARKKEVDDVQSALDTHKQDNVVHLNQAEHAKLTNIEAGAQVNQNAFSNVNGIAATDPSDSITIEGATGITVTKDGKRIIVTATGQAAPGAHAETHLPGGSDAIQLATTVRPGLMSAAHATALAAAESKTDSAAKLQTAKDYTDTRLDTEKSVNLTLAAGTQVVKANKASRFRLTGLSGKTEINGQGRTGIVGVEGPCAMATSDNLIAPMYEWLPGGTTPAFAVPTSKNSGEIRATSASSAFFYTDLYLPPGKTVTLSLTGNGYVSVTSITDGSVLISNAIGQSFTFNTGSTAQQIRVYFSNVKSDGAAVAGTFSFANPMLVIGNTAGSFKPQSRSMLALQTELHANPTDGTDPDLVVERAGQYFKVAKWRKVIILDQYTYSVPYTGSGFKQVQLLGENFPITGHQGIFSKYDGALLPGYTGVPSQGDLATISQNSGAALPVIKNTDSGWGNSYTPTSDEVKAYFLGWKMYDTSGATTGQYNGSGAKGWVRRRKSDGAFVDGTGTLPTVIAPEWTPYNLLCKLASPAVEPITAEGQLVLSEGDNIVEVGSGIVLREAVKPTADSANYNINNASVGGLLKYKADRFIDVYKDGLRDKWSFLGNTTTSAGALAQKSLADFDKAGAYSTSYIKMDKSPIASFTGMLTDSEKAQLVDLIRNAGDTAARVSVLESKKIEKVPLSWIEPTLFNGWKNYGAVNVTDNTYYNLSYAKDAEGFVHLRGMIAGGVVPSQILSLPLGYRPRKTCLFIGVNSDIAKGNCRIDVLANGAVQVMNGDNAFVSLENISFLAEQ